REQHSSYYAHIMAQRTEDFKGAQQRQALLETEADGENVRTAWQWSVEQHQVGQLSQSVDGLCQFYLWRGRFREAEALMRSALSTLGITITATIDPQPLLLQIKLLIWQGIFARILGRREAAEQSLKVTLQLLIHESLHDHDTQSLQAFALLHLGETMREVDRTAARQYYEQSLALYRASDYPWGVANTLDALGWLIQHWGSYDEARQIYQESLTIRQTLDDRRGVANALRAVGGVALYQGDLVQAEKLIRDSIAMMSPKGDRIGLATCLGKLGETLINGGRFQEAEVPLNEAKAIYEGLGMADSKAFIEAILGLALLHQGDYAEAQQRTTSVLDYFQSVGSRRGSAYARLILGWIFLAQNAVTKAYEHLEESRTIYVELSQRDELGQTHALLALVAHLRHNPEGAEHHLQQAQQIAESIQAFMPHLLALAVTTRIQRTQNETPTVWLHNQIAHHPIVVASCWFGQLLSTGD
ncbi:MAG: tetratricopeptide repeat protein, partial [Caldilineaceae bacterium]|nr:tetratricopeptide repeat protein [Caldilineaceae bacterium]